MFTRSRLKDSDKTSDGNSDEGDNLNETLVEMNPTEQNMSAAISQQQLTTLLSTVSALQESVNALQRENEQMRKERDNAGILSSPAGSFSIKSTSFVNTSNDIGSISTTAVDATSVSTITPCTYSATNLQQSLGYMPYEQFSSAANSSTTAPAFVATNAVCTSAGSQLVYHNQSPYLLSIPNVAGNLGNTPNPGQYLSSQPSTRPEPSVYHSLASEQYRGTVTYVDNPAAKLYPLPSFNGDPEDWPLFKASYIDTTREFGYNNKQNLIRLQKALSGNAKQKVSSLLIFPDEVAHVLDELEFNFGRPELLLRVQMQKIQQCPVIIERNTEQIVEFSNKVRNIVAFLKCSNCHHHLMSPMLLELLVLKLPASKQFEWSRHILNTPHPNLQVFSDWLSELAKVVSLMPSIYTAVQPPVSAASWRQNGSPTKQQSLSQSSSRQSNYSSSTSRRMLYTSESSENKAGTTCVKCNQEHQLQLCGQFKALSVSNRWEFVKQRRLCFSCLQGGHNLSNCQFKKPCGIDTCGRMHHALLHNSTPSPVAVKPNSVETQDNAHVLNTSINKNTSCLFKVLPVIVSGPKGSVKIYAMMDEGSSVTLLEESVAKVLGVQGHNAPLTLQWYNEKQTTEKSSVVTLEVRGLESASYCLKNVRTVEHLDLPTQSFRKGAHEHLAQSSVSDYNNVKPSLLIGLDNSFLCTPNDTIDAGPNQPIAVSTKLGWLAYGPVESVSVAKVLHVRQSSRENQLHQLVEDYFSIENFGVKHTTTPLESNEVSRSRRILEETTRYLGDRYEVGLLWRENTVQLPLSYDMAKRRLISIENKMKKDAHYAAIYKAEIAKYVDKGYANPLTISEAQYHTSRTWYLPHFGVVNPNKPNKMRIVFDAAAVVGNTSLNSVLLKGPEHAQSLMAIMYKFRQRRIAVAGDIEAMFSQIKVTPEDRNAQRFLWRDGNQSEPIRVYVMSSMIFGATCSPCCAEYIKNKNAEQYMQYMPRGARAVIQNTYVDDLVISFDDEQEAAEVVNEAIVINAKAGFKLRNFVSNSKQLQHQLNGQSIGIPNVINMDQSQTDKILGMYWNSNNDALEFHFRFYKICREVIDCLRGPTKRELLAIAMSIYDPFGLLANVTITIKILIQATWKQNIQWDDPLPAELEKQWAVWWSAFQNVEHFSVPRCLSPRYSTADDIQLHIFVDASETAYAAVAYLRLKKEDNIEVAFLSGKSRCAPKREISVPRLELQAAVMGSRLKCSMEECLEQKVHSITFWSDSKTVLLWIRSTKRNFKQFVANRIAEILNSTVPSQWRWIPSAINASDAATKIKSPPECQPDSLWVKGPDFLYASENMWPEEPLHIYSEYCAKEETTKCLMITTNKVEYIVEINKFSSYLRLLRVIAWVKRFVDNVNLQSRQGELTADELKKAEISICRQVQQATFSKEIYAIQTNKSLPKSSALYQLTPKLDEEGILRVNGRIDAAYCLPYSARHPIILPHGHALATLVMDYYHRNRHHQNDQLTINEMRQHFWIPRSRQLLKTIKRNCPVCIRISAKPAVPLMGQLPPDRLTPYVRPFTYAGVDYCGPFLVAIGRRREKRWVALFTCLTTRAVHIEIAEDLSTDAFIVCMRNFVNRRGVPMRLRSDNGTNFIGAQRLLERDQQVFDFDVIQQEAAKNRIEWVFNCPGHPAAGGCWERLVQCVKRILQRVLKDEAPRIETFRSVLIEAENIINSRPLTDIPVSPDSPEPLTPNHFLLGCLNSTQTPAASEENICLRKQWRIAQNLKNRFWKRWIVEYLPQLLTRQKWHEEVHPLEPGQLVVVCDSQLPRSQWQTGRIVEVISAKDGQVRSATVRTSHGILRRPTCKLAALAL